VRNGTTKFVPKRFEKTYFNWMENIRDWCISRQLWWGHRIPAWYCDDCGGITVQETAPHACAKCSSVKLRQDEDVLDTWFSSGMWPFSTLGYPDKTEELKYFYPTSTLVTGYDIIFFWVARMMVFGLNVMGDKPFDTVFVHGIVRDSLGRKMSKSLGNGIDPLEVIEKHGADSLRFSLITGNSAGNDMRFFWEKVEAARNFCNKVYNAARFVLMNVGDKPVGEIDMNALDIADKWVLTKLNGIIKEVRYNLDAFELNLAAQKIYDFIWSEFCDWFIEMAKHRLYGDDEKAKTQVRAVLVHVLTDAMKLLHPFMPFITEELYLHLPNAEETIMLSDFPQVKDAFDFAQEAEQMEAVMELIRSVRNVRADMNVPPAKRISAILVAEPSFKAAFENAAVYMNRLAGIEEVHLQENADHIPVNAVSIVSAAAEAFVPLEQLVDIEKERERVKKEIERINGEIKRAEGKLNNVGFVAKAPAHVVEEEKTKLQNAKDMLEKLLKRQDGLK
ncbi:class I tRNA ligase family protein, partial [Christensenellaceae bacterium OttesenSCG-928-M15]|nr:class I tRNA ligase family protein [Christensenellaceae bacterium OttesenSCG-928-M15]